MEFDNLDNTALEKSNKTDSEYIVHASISFLYSLQ